MITNQTMTVSITCSGNFNCIGHCYAWDWGDFVSNCSMGLFWTGDWIKVRHNVDSFSSITRPTERRSVTSCDVTLPSFLTEAAICIVVRWSKVWPIVPECNHVQESRTCHFCHFLQDDVLLSSKNNFAAIATWRNDFSSLFKKKKDDKTAAI